MMPHRQRIVRPKGPWLLPGQPSPSTIETVTDRRHRWEGRAEQTQRVPPLRHQCRFNEGIPHPRHRPGTKSMPANDVIPHPRPHPGSGRGSCPASPRCPSYDTLTPRNLCPAWGTDTIAPAKIHPVPNRGHLPYQLNRKAQNCPLMNQVEPDARGSSSRAGS